MMKFKTVKSSRAGCFKRMWQDEDGGIFILAAFLFFLMAGLGGIAVDVTQYERARTFLQNNLDGAVLSAASLSQTIEAEASVLSFLSAAGITGDGITVFADTDKVGEIAVGRTVNAKIQARVPTFFLRFFGTDAFTVTIESEASERIDNIEISMVLDVSGSMGLDSYNRPDLRKINALKAAAKDFVAKVLADAEGDTVSISLIPYSTKVNVGPALLNEYTVSDEHSYSNCVDFQSTNYESTAIDPDVELQRTGHFQFQAWSSSNKERGQWVCRIDDGFVITPVSNNLVALNNAIDALSAEGSTSIDMGVKWGVALLDPSARTPVSNLIASGAISESFEGRPYNYDAPNSMKVMIVMTDGQNFPEYYLDASYADGPSNVWKTTKKSDNSEYYSVYAPEKYGYKDSDYISSETYFYGVHPFGTDRRWDNATIFENSALPGGKSAFYGETQLTWPQVWADMSPYWYGYNLVGRLNNSSSYWSSTARNFWNNMHSEVSPTEKDSRLRDICDAAKTEKVVVFTIGFEVASTSSLDLLKDCASTEAHYFDVKDTEIKDAFEMIASSISMLRLTK